MKKVEITVYEFNELPIGKKELVKIESSHIGGFDFKTAGEWVDHLSSFYYYENGSIYGKIEIINRITNVENTQKWALNKISDFIEKETENLGSLTITDSASENYIKDVCERYFDLRIKLAAKKTKPAKNENGLILAATITFKNEINGKVIRCDIKHPEHDEDELTVGFEFGDGGSKDHEGEWHSYFASVVFNKINNSK